MKPQAGPFSIMAGPTYGLTRFRVGVGSQKAGPLALAFSYQPLRLMVRRRFIEVALVIPPNMQAGVPQ